MKQTFTHSSICFTLRRIWKFPTLLPGLFVLLLTFFTACGGDDGAEDGTYAVVEAASFTFNENDPTKNVIQVLANTEWTVYWTPETSGVSVSPATGSGNGSFYVADMPAGQTLKFGVKTASGKAVSQFATVTRTSGSGGDDEEDDGDDDTPTGEIVFSLDFGAAPASAAFADSFTSWQTQTGSGAGSVGYASYGVKIRSGYDGASAGASGKGYATMTATKATNYFTVKNISLPAGVQNFTLSFYAAFATGDVVLSVSDGSSTRALTYQASSSYNVWSEVTVGFTLANPVSNLTITLAPSQAFNFNDRQYGLNFDDIVLTTGGGGQQIDFGASGKEYRWAELPATPADMTNKKIYTFWSTTVSTKQYLRNYTYCYDTKRHCPLWIAHPQHACYEEGGRTRPETQPWAADPNMTQAEQAIIWVWPGDNRDKYVVSESPLYRWGRGHMLASGYRGCGDANNPAEINVQTFYSCNIAPQGGEVFSSLWQQAEWRIQDKYVCADTLYCVSGAHFDEGAIAAYDGSWVNSNAQTRGHIDESKPCEVPTHYYKLILRTRNGNTGKAIQDCDASELKAVGFWFENGDGTDDSGAATPTLDASYLKSVEWIEQQTGFTFFPDVPPSVKQQCNPSDWKL